MSLLCVISVARCSFSPMHNNLYTKLHTIKNLNLNLNVPYGKTCVLTLTKRD